MKAQSYLLLSVFVLIQGNIAYSASRDASGGGNDAAYKMKLMLRQVMSEKEALKSKNIQLDAELNKLKSKIKKKDNKIKSTNRKLKKLGDQGKKLSEKLQESYNLVTDLRKKKNQIKFDLRKITILNSNTELELRQCMKMNIDLFSAGSEVLNKYEKEVSDSSEPVFKLKFVELENVIQDYRFKMEDLSIPKNEIQKKIKLIERNHESVSALRPKGNIAGDALADDKLAGNIENSNAENNPKESTEKQ